MVSHMLAHVLSIRAMSQPIGFIQSDREVAYYSPVKVAGSVALDCVFCFLTYLFSPRSFTALLGGDYMFNYIHVTLFTMRIWQCDIDGTHTHFCLRIQLR